MVAAQERWRRRQGQLPLVEHLALVTKPHGTRGKYVKGCRCEKCTRAAAEYQADYRRRMAIKAVH